VLLCGDPDLDLPHSFQRLVPPPFQFFGDQTIFRICGAELPLCPLCRITRCFQVALQRLQDFILTARFIFTGLHRCFHGRRLHRFEHLCSDRFVHWDSTERNTTRLAIIEPSTIARVAQHIVAVASVPHR
jgi:hypothetical protein